MRKGRRTNRATLLLYVAATLMWTRAADPSPARAGAFFALPAGLSPLNAVEPATDSLLLQNAFHIVGIPKLQRNARVDLTLGARSLLVRQGAKERISLPYARLRSVEVVDGTRTYGKATYAAVMTAGVAGALLLPKRQHVSTLVIDFLNQRRGQRGLILQVPLGQGAACRDCFRRPGAAVVGPPFSESLPQQEMSSEKGDHKP